ncbi:MAG: hypothetical protein E3J50_01745 [Dehalococcoidia bacterium]|nr:MAG: hypothetical protein E3J50_01745 [Dehalococcoidia bacterium]
MDEFKAFNIEREKHLRTAVPVLKDAYAAHERKLVDSRHYGDHIWVFGDIVAVHFIEEAFTPKGMLNLKAVKPFLHLRPDCYVSADRKCVNFRQGGT